MIDAPVLAPPATLRVDSAGIPAALRALPQFVVWSWVYRIDRWKKPPLRADGRGDAASNDARTWAGCDDALAAYRGRNLDGIGFAVATDDPFFFVDLDDCRDPATGEVAPWVQPILDRFQITYGEISPSGTGFKIVGRGTPPRQQMVTFMTGERPRAKIEIYDSIRYTTLTGHRLPGAPPEVRDAQEALDWLARDVVADARDDGDASVADEIAAALERARHARNGVDFCRLFDAGDLNEYGNDAESGARALVAMLAARFGADRFVIDQAFRRSALMHDWWDERDGHGRTNGERMVDGAVLN